VRCGPVGACLADNKDWIAGISCERAPSTTGMGVPECVCVPSNTNWVCQNPAAKSPSSHTTRDVRRCTNRKTPSVIRRYLERRQSAGARYVYPCTLATLTSYGNSLSVCRRGDRTAAWYLARFGSSGNGSCQAVSSANVFVRSRCNPASASSLRT
jgi:hypothetical protein